MKCCPCHLYISHHSFLFSFLKRFTSFSDISVKKSARSLAACASAYSSTFSSVPPSAGYSLLPISISSLHSSGIYCLLAFSHRLFLHVRFVILADHPVSVHDKTEYTVAFFPASFIDRKFNRVETVPHLFQNPD